MRSAGMQAVLQIECAQPCFRTRLQLVHSRMARAKLVHTASAISVTMRTACCSAQKG